MSSNQSILLAVESFEAPRILDSGSCDFRAPLRRRDDLSRLRNTLSVRNCYRSQRIGLGDVTHKNKAITVCLHGADSDLVYGSVRLTFWRKRSACPLTGIVAVTGALGDDVYFEAACITRSLSFGAAAGSVTVAGDFDSVVVTVFQQCRGFSLHVSEPESGDASTIPTVGLTSAQ